jgi:adenylate cyclase
MSFVRELKRRNVFRVGIAYAIAAWLLLQIIDVVIPIIEAPEWVSKAILLLIAVGFPVAILFAWAFELTPDGLKFERDVDRSQSVTTDTGRKLDFAIIAVLGIAVVLFSLDKFLWSATPDDEALASKRSIAVIPFINMSDDPGQVFFSDGISEEILNALVRADGISVASRTSSFGYRNHEQSIPVIAEDLGVLFVLEGSVRKAGDQLRITAQLIDAEQDRHLWSETYDRGLTDVFAVQSDIANSITKAIRSELGIESDAAIEVKALTQNMTAYDLYLKATQAYIRRLTLEDVRNAESWFLQAVEIDPEFAAAWEGLAGVYATLPFWGDEVRTLEEFMRLSNEAADRALSLDPELAYAYGIKASNLSAMPPYDLVSSVAQSERATEMDPGNATLHHWHGISLQLSGYFEEGLAAQLRCLDIDPMYVNCVLYVEQGLHAIGRHTEAMDYIDRYIEQMAEWDLTAIRAAEFMLTGNRWAALLIASNIDGLRGAPVFEFIKALENPTADHTEGLRRFDAWADENDVDLGRYPEILAALGAFSRADNPLISEMWYWLPNYRTYRQSPEFKESLHKYGTYDLWRVKGFPPQCRPVGDDDVECD